MTTCPNPNVILPRKAPPRVQSKKRGNLIDTSAKIGRKNGTEASNNTTCAKKNASMKKVKAHKIDTFLSCIYCKTLLHPTPFCLSCSYTVFKCIPPYSAIEESIPTAPSKSLSYSDNGLKKVFDHFSKTIAFMLLCVEHKLFNTWRIDNLIKFAKANLYSGFSRV